MNIGQTDHFEKQARSKRWSLVFAVSFGLCLLALFFALFMVFRLFPFHGTRITHGSSTYKPLRYIPRDKPPSNVYPALVLSLITVSGVMVISSSRVYQMKQGGGTYVPSVLKAIPLGDDGFLETPEGKRQEKIFRNVVSELSVVTGLAEPDLYVLPNEDSINAMAAGIDTDDSSIIITKGALKYLNRSELMALMAHEFSHLANSDTRHFTLMAGWLHGLLCLNTAAFRFTMQAPQIWIICLGLLVSALGFFGSVLARIIQAAFSRARERLADQSATQFTRDPLALASVLKKIGGQGALKFTSVLRHPDFRHLYAAKPPSRLDEYKFPSWVQVIFSSHPPIEDRIWELDPDWDGWYWDYEKNPVDYLAHPFQPTEPPLPQTAKTRSVLIPMP
ncbi:MAG: M48 family metalloprotease [Deltaproteobacteria bacterium]|nr:M48 family metalloprotease [Deltaproteobacteria bacterium]